MNAAVRPHTPAPSISEEVWLCKRLGKIDLFDGTITVADRRERLRAWLLTHHYGDAFVGRRGGREETWRELFERMYGEPLSPLHDDSTNQTTRGD